MCLVLDRNGPNLEVLSQKSKALVGFVHDVVVCFFQQRLMEIVTPRYFASLEGGLSGGR